MLTHRRERERERERERRGRGKDCRCCSLAPPAKANSIPTQMPSAKSVRPTKRITPVLFWNRADCPTWRFVALIPNVCWES